MPGCVKELRQITIKLNNGLRYICVHLDTGAVQSIEAMVDARRIDVWLSVCDRNNRCCDGAELSSAPEK